jgi:hypothetical protein
VKVNDIVIDFVNDVVVVVVVVFVVDGTRRLDLLLARSKRW